MQSFDLNTLYFAAVFLPLLSFVVVGAGCRIWPRAVAGWLAALLQVGAALAAVYIFQMHLQSPLSLKIPVLDWLSVGDFKAQWSLRLDALSAIMLIVVNCVSAVVHLYSLSYMGHDASQNRFMAYLGLFTFAMLMLVTSDNFLQLYFGWEGVGLASYLLIGFWYERPTANAAAIKAFVVNRVGDFGLALGILALFALTGTIQFDGVFAAASALANTEWMILGVSVDALTVICLLLFLGAMGKSAQLGLHVWLPDAMEGPTPVSALIHAATMVTAGVFMLARLSPLYEFSQTALDVVAVVGGLTAVFAATVALVQTDIKRVIAYSTCSQLGYMFLAIGVSAYQAAIFHLFTHAFFKALLFLGSGAVIHGLHGEQDMRRMGGLWKEMPITYALMWIGSLGLAGIPPFAGYYSKDLILEMAFASHSAVGQFVFVLGIAAVLMTAFYSWRLLIMTFHGNYHGDEENLAHAHDAPPMMWMPMLVLVAGTVLAGMWGHELFAGHGQSEFWGQALFFAPLHGMDLEMLHHHLPEWVPVLPLVLSVVGLTFASYVYLRHPHWPQAWAERLPVVYRFLVNKWYFDWLYERIFVRPALWLGKVLWQDVDVDGIDRLGPNGVSRLTQWGAGALSRVQSGRLYHYAMAMMIGVVGLLGWLIWRNWMGWM